VQFTNTTNTVLLVPSLSFEVQPGEQTPELTTDQAAGFVEQADVWTEYTAPAEGETN
jgi:hypothetical protein